MQWGLSSVGRAPRLQKPFLSKEKPWEKKFSQRKTLEKEIYPEKPWEKKFSQGTIDGRNGFKVRGGREFESRRVHSRKPAAPGCI